MKNNIKDSAQLIENQRKLADYIKTSLWDEAMNRKRERWLWEHSCRPTTKSKTY